MRRRQLLRQYERERRLAPPPKPIGLEDMGDDALADVYAREFGKPPSKRMKRATIIGKINDARRHSA